MKTFARAASFSLCMLALVACAPSASPPASTVSSSGDASQEAVARAGDVTVRASAVPTLSLSPEIATRYGIERNEDSVLLLVMVRRGTEESAVGARIQATATDLRGRPRPIEMRELRMGELLDYVGVVEADLPDTLRFDVQVTRNDGGTSNLQFTRDFRPQ